MALLPIMMGYSYTAYGCMDDIYCQIVITSSGVIERATYSGWSGPLPGIY